MYVRTRDPARQPAVNSGDRRLAAGDDATIQFAYDRFADGRAPAASSRIHCNAS